MCTMIVMPTGARGRSGGLPTLEQAQAFCAAADHHTYRKAAQALGVRNHVSVIRLVGRFGDALPTGALVTANSRGEVTLTAAGAAVLPFARRFLDAARGMANVKPGVRFSAYPSIAGQVVSSCSELLDASPPLLLTNVSETARQDGGRQMVLDVAAEVLDVAVAPTGTDAKGVSSRPLYEWTLRVMLPDSADHLGGRAWVTPPDLRGIALAAAPAGHLSRRLLEGVFAQAGESLEVAVESNSQEVLRDLVSKGRRHAAVLPDDAFGPSEAFGPAITTVAGDRWGGSYSTYVRDGSAFAPDRTAIERMLTVIHDRLGRGVDAA